VQSSLSHNHQIIAYVLKLDCTGLLLQSTCQTKHHSRLGRPQRKYMRESTALPLSIPSRPNRPPKYFHPQMLDHTPYLLTSHKCKGGTYKSMLSGKRLLNTVPVDPHSSFTASLSFEQLHAAASSRAQDCFAEPLHPILDTRQNEPLQAVKQTPNILGTHKTP
jgi:hypothetical protein